MKRTAYLGVFLAFALLLSYVESLVPFYFGIPGAKLGLANLAVILALYLYGWREALLIDVARVLLSGFLFGSLFSVMYSLAGAVCSYLVMCGLKKTDRFGMTGVSMAGGISHNAGQILVAVFVTRTPGVAFYLPALTAAGLITGTLIGLLSLEMRRHLEKLIH